MTDHHVREVSPEQLQAFHEFNQLFREYRDDEKKVKLLRKNFEEKVKSDTLLNKFRLEKEVFVNEAEAEYEAKVNHLKDEKDRKVKELQAQIEVIESKYEKDVAPAKEHKTRSIDAVVTSSEVKQRERMNVLENEFLPKDQKERETRQLERKQRLKDLCCIFRHARSQLDGKTFTMVVKRKKNPRRYNLGSCSQALVKSKVTIDVDIAKSIILNGYEDTYEYIPCFHGTDEDKTMLITALRQEEEEEEDVKPRRGKRKDAENWF
jgi:hypothetical protein